MRRAAAELLGRLGDADSIESLMKATENASGDIPQDLVLHHSIVYAMLEIAQPDKVEPFLKSDSLRQRQAALVVLSQLKSWEALDGQLESLWEQGDDELRSVVLEVLKLRTEWASKHLSLIDKLWSRSESDESVRFYLAELMSSWKTQEDVREKVANWLVQSAEKESAQTSTLLMVLQRIGAMSIDSESSKALTQWLKQQDRESIDPLLEWIAIQKLDRASHADLIQTLATQAESPAIPQEKRWAFAAALPADGTLSLQTQRNGSVC